MTVRHAFVDESVRPDGWYRLTIVDVDARDLAVISRAIRSLIPRGRSRVHFSSENTARRRQMLDVIVAQPIRAITYAAPYRRGENDEPSRNLCLAALVESLGSTVTVVSLDTRGADRDRNDRRILRSGLSSAGRVDSVSYAHRGSRDEVLLSLPDAIGWAIGAAGHFSAVASRVTETVLVNPLPNLQQGVILKSVRSTRREK
jgi:hypothetical protein